MKTQSMPINQLLSILVLDKQGFEAGLSKDDPSAFLDQVLQMKAQGADEVEITHDGDFVREVKPITYRGDNDPRAEKARRAGLTEN